MLCFVSKDAAVQQCRKFFKRKSSLPKYTLDFIQNINCAISYRFWSILSNIIRN